MGLCLGSLAHGRQAEAEANTTATTTPVGSSKIIESSGTSSSNGKSLFSEGASMLSMDEYPDGKILEAPNLKEFTFTDLKTATKNFKSDSVLGEGGFGRVFKGWVDEKTLAPSKAGIGMVVAIKKLNSESMQGFQEWQSEVNFLGRLSHPNLVRLLGYCWEDKELLLVYEFMSKGSLENHLFRRNPIIEPISWDIRLKILIGAAWGLTFLHTSEKNVIYRDFKASNILLDRNYNAKISDFGLAKLGPSGDDSHVTTRVMGTYGYAAPEYIATGHLYVKSDVYGFGVVLLEMLTGLQAFDKKRPSGKQNLVEWLKPSLSSKRKLKSIMDIRMEGQYSTKAALQAGQLTLKCLKSDPKSRPAMKEVVEELEGLEAMKEKPKDCKTKSTHSTPHHHSQHPIHHSFTDLKTATKNFKPDSVLGEGGFGKVFKGWVDEKTLAPSNSCTGMAVAIKKWNPESMQGFQEWKSEVYVLGRLSHPNLIRLLGYCQEDKELLLVYEFMSKGSLDNHLFRRNPNNELLSWNIRLKIIVGAARGLAFLHSSVKKVICRNFKTRNILLDENYNAKISNFGLAILGPSGADSHVTTGVVGTYGYAAPKYIATGHLYTKSDVYGFGVVLLEMLTGKRAVDANRRSGQQNLVEWLKPSLSNKRKLKSIMDIRMEGQYSTEAALLAVKLTLKCLESEPKNRPAMKEVVETLERIEANR